MFSSFASLFAGTPARPAPNYSVEALWGAENRADYWHLLALADKITGPQRILEQGEALYKVGLFGLKCTTQIADIEARKFVLQKSGTLSMLGSATSRYETYIHGSKYYGTNGEIYSNREEYPLDTNIISRFFNIAVQFAALALFADDFNRFCSMMGGINRVINTLKQTYSQVDLTDLVIKAIDAAILLNVNGIVILALYNLLLKNLRDSLYAPNSDIVVLSLYEDILLKAIALAAEIDVEFFKSQEFKSRYGWDSAHPYNKFYDDYVNQFDLKYDELQCMRRRFKELRVDDFMLQAERARQNGLPLEGTVGYAGEKKQLHPTLRRRKPTFG